MKKIILPIFLFSFTGFSQMLGPNVTGNIESMFQYLNADSTIGAVQPPEKAVLNSFALINYSLKDFRAGVRFESYLPHVLGYPDRFSGSGIGYRYAGYYGDKIEFTVGNFYDQFGSGMIFRSYEQRQLGVDNAMDGLSVKIRPTAGFQVKAVYGKMRYSFENGRIVNDGVVRGVDAEIDFKSFYNILEDTKWNVNVGASFVSKYQNYSHPLYNMPQNVGSYGGRVDLKYSRFFMNIEHIIKEQDPSFDNNYIYNFGHGTYISLGYSQKGLGIIVSGKSVDNLSYRTDPDATLTDLNISFLPPLTKAHTYNLAATLYPYGSQPIGEVSYQADIFYKIPKKTKLGGKYGTLISINFATVYEPIRHVSDQYGIDFNDSTRVLYKTKLFDASSNLYYRDFNIEIKRKLNKKMNLTLKYFHFDFNNDINIVSKDATGIVTSNIGVIDFGYKFNRKHSIRVELQGLWTNTDPSTGKKQDKGDWATVLIEYNISPKFFFAVMDQYNYGNPIETNRQHYIIGSAGYTFGSNKIMVVYGKQREGIFCIGGVCRSVPATNGLTVTFTSTF